MRQNYTSLRTGPAGLLEIQVAESVVNRRAVVDLVCLRLVGLGADNHICARFGDLPKHAGLLANWHIALWKFHVTVWVRITLPKLNVHNYKIGLLLGGRNVGLHFCSAKRIGTRGR